MHWHSSQRSIRCCCSLAAASHCRTTHLAVVGRNPNREPGLWCGRGDGYQGINTVFVSPTGLPFELQFHTPESLSMKEEACHSSYEKFRSASDSSKMIQYWEEMVSMWDM